MTAFEAVVHRVRWSWVVAVLLAVYALFLGSHFAPIAAGADSGGYLGSARMLAEGELRGRLRSIPEFPLDGAGPFTYVPLGYLDEHGSGLLTPTYPVGLPLHYALAGRLAGWWWGPLLVGVIGAVVAVLATYLCLRELEVSPPLAAASAAMLALSPLALFVSLVPLSDTIATAWCTVAMLAAFRARRGSGWALVAGAAFSIAFLVRPTNVLLAPALALLLWPWRHWLLAVLGSLPGLAFALWYNHALYGSPWMTGYGSSGSLFRADLVRSSMSNYLHTLPNVLPFAVVALLVLPFLPWRQKGRDWLALLLWFAAYAGFYSFYEYTHHTWWYLRFILPGFPALIILGGAGMSVLLTQAAAKQAGRRAALAVALVVSGALAWSAWQVRELRVMGFPGEQKPHFAAPTWAARNLPPNSVVFCFHLSGAFYFYTDFPILRSDQFSPAQFNGFVEAIRKTGRPVYAAIFRFDEEDAFGAHLRGPWRKVADVMDAGIWRLEPGPAK